MVGNPSNRVTPPPAASCRSPNDVRTAWPPAKCTTREGGRLAFFERALAFMAGYWPKSFLIAQPLSRIERAYNAVRGRVDVLGPVKAAQVP